jgi:hypothetical protein
VRPVPIGEIATAGVKTSPDFRVALHPNRGLAARSNHRPPRKLRFAKVRNQMRHLVGAGKGVPKCPDPPRRTGLLAISLAVLSQGAPRETGFGPRYTGKDPPTMIETRGLLRLNFRISRRALARGCCLEYRGLAPHG